MSATASVLKLGPADAGRFLTSEEFACADFVEPYRYERANGRLVVVAPVGESHIAGTEPWRDHLGIYKLQHPDVVERVVSEAWMRVDHLNDRIGDIGVYLRSDAPSAPIPDRVPDLVVEIVSPGRRAHQRDYVVLKRDHYRALGVKEYIVSDREAGRVSVFTGPSWDQPARILGPADACTSPLMPGLMIPLREVL